MRSLKQHCRCLILILICSPVLTAADGPRLTPDKIRRIEQAISTAMSRHTIPGVNAAIGIGSEVKWAEGLGLADVENTVPATSHTAIRLGSIAKPITAVAVLQLVEDRRIQLDSPIQEYVPQFPAKQWPVTVRQLLGHLGGVRHYRDDEISSTRHYLNRQEPLNIFAADPLALEPGTKYLYSTYGFNLLGAAVELASGMPFARYLETRVFKPAGMDSIRDDDTYAIIPHRSRGYALLGTGQLINCGLADTSNKLPGGGLISPASDLVRFALAFNDGRLTKSSTVDTMLSSQTTREGKPTGYGMGFSVGVRNGRRYAYHGGGQQGTSTYLIFFPSERVSIAVMANREGAPVSTLANEIEALLFEP